MFRNAETYDAGSAVLANGPRAKLHLPVVPAIVGPRAIRRAQEAMASKFEDAAKYAHIDGDAARVATMDAATATLDAAATADATEAYYFNQLQAHDPTLNQPLYNATWMRDLPMRDDVTLAMTVASYTKSTFTSTGSLQSNGKHWHGQNSNTPGGVDVAGQLITNPVRPLAFQVKYNVFELASSMALGTPIDAQKIEYMKTSYQQDMDEMAYIGEPMFANCFGLVNNPAVSTTTASASGTNGATQWATKTPDAIRADINALLYSAYMASGFNVVPDTILLPPFQHSLLIATITSIAGANSILEFIQQNNLYRTFSNGGTLRILPLKWLLGGGNGGTRLMPNTVDRAVAYSKDKRFVQMPVVPLQMAGNQYYNNLDWVMDYVAKTGQVEFRYEETFSYLDGI